MARRGRHARQTRQPTIDTTQSWQMGDRVLVDFGGDLYGGEIVKIKTRVALVTFDDGEQHEIDLARLVRETQPPVDNGDSDEEDDLPEERPSVTQGRDGDVTFNPPKKFGKGMHHYPITWDKGGTFFNVWVAPEGDDLELGESPNRLSAMLTTAKNKMVHFVGTWRRTEFARADERGKIVRERCPGWSIDMYAKIEYEGTGDQTYMVESLSYEEAEDQPDPRRDMHSLNSDICAAIRKWFFFELRGDAETVRQLRKRAERPQINVPSLNWLDHFISKAMEVRNTALRSGGQRQIVIETGMPNDPIISLCVNFTTLAIASDGEVPPLYHGGALEGAIKAGGKKGTRTTPMVLTPDPANVNALAKRVAELNVLAKSGDMQAKSEARKIRAAMRQMGHSGGARSATSMTKDSQPDE